MRLRHLFATFGSLVGLSLPASAQDIDVVDIFTGTGDEGSNRLLNMIFGPLFPGPNDETIISALITNFNVLFLALGMALLVYHLIAGVTQTAHDGEFLGKRSSSIWAPIRMVVAAGLLIPLPTGYNGVQHLVAYAAKSGTAAASFFWGQTADKVIAQRINVAGIDFNSNDTNLIAGLWKLELCRATYNGAIQKAGGGLPEVGFQGTLRSSTVNGRSTTNVEYTYKAGNFASCGSIIMPAETLAFSRFSEGDPGRGSYDEYRNAMGQAVIDRQMSITGVADRVAEALDDRTAVPELRSLQSDDIGPWREAHSAILRSIIGGDNAANELRRIVSESGEISFTPLGSQEAPNVQLATSMKDDGWTQAGFYYQTIARLSGDTASIARAVPTIEFGNLITASSDPDGRAAAAFKRSNGWFGGLFSGGTSDSERMLEDLTKLYAESLEWFYNSAEEEGIQNITRDRVNVGDQISDLPAFLPSAGNLWEALDILDPSEGAGTDPLVAVIQIGQIVSNLMAAIVGLVSAAAGIPVVGGIAVAFATLAGWLISGLGGLASFMAFALPMLPTIIWVLAILSFLLLVVQGVFAGPLWAIAHLSLEGEGLGGQGARRGYLMLLSILITPMLMVFGLLVGMTLFRIVGTLFNSGIHLALTGAQALGSDANMGLEWYFGLFTVFVLVVVAYVVMIERTMSATTWLPNAVMNVLDAWVGGIGVSEQDVSSGVGSTKGQTLIGSQQGQAMTSLAGRNRDAQLARQRGAGARRLLDRT